MSMVMPAGYTKISCGYSKQGIVHKAKSIGRRDKKIAKTIEHCLPFTIYGLQFTVRIQS